MPQYANIQSFLGRKVGIDRTSAVITIPKRITSQLGVEKNSHYVMLKQRQGETVFTLHLFPRTVTAESDIEKNNGFALMTTLPIIVSESSVVKLNKSLFTMLGIQPKSHLVNWYFFTPVKPDSFVALAIVSKKEEATQQKSKELTRYLNG
jgi:hypothetical protein